LKRCCQRSPALGRLPILGAAVDHALLTAMLDRGAGA
jgi:hypothetical protein